MPQNHHIYQNSTFGTAEIQKQARSEKRVPKQETQVKLSQNFDINDYNTYDTQSIQAKLSEDKAQNLKHTSVTQNVLQTYNPSTFWALNSRIDNQKTQPKLDTQNQNSQKEGVKRLLVNDVSTFGTKYKETKGSKNILST